ncbi:[Ribulose-bisphosphate carboxylase]-lysine N-methyltransferase protein [Dioscorea alata]|uniref:[Ribulose-bisphosphate carboxylase]-lysine N-methyltransferase protein n=1 Tax=Dioscorea alata TaxID=55571 RepID=A0ACB7VDH2_DIOAL|nr:[Ribulose-bisphosphate carboxylase]-lysine N-methyltransferase protein [Dioscorea alata]
MIILVHSAPEMSLNLLVLKFLLDQTEDIFNAVGAGNIVEMISNKFNSSAEDSLLKWGRTHGVETKLRIAYFEGAGRGAVAIEDLSIGDTALEIPKSLIISEDVLHESDMNEVFKELDGISADTMMLLWSMRERHNSESRFRFYFEALPEEFHTGLSFGIDALTTLEGTLLFEELLQAKEHLRQQYDELCHTLFSNHPKIFQPELYSWEQFLWACELWYSNGMKVILSDGKLKTCLVPIAGLLNHSICPHIIHYGRVDSATKSLKFPLSRPCKKGEQCYLSYGSFPGSHFVTFYGFLPKGDNPYDVIPLDIEAPHAEDTHSASDWTTHMVRGTWLSKSKEPPSCGLPSPLLYHLRSIIEYDGNQLPPSPSRRVEIERAVIETIISIFKPMMESLSHTDDFDREISNWDVKLALDYKDLQRKIISSVLASSTIALQMLS